VTGAAGHLARALIPRLLADPGVEAVVGIDRCIGSLRDPRLTQHRMDIRDPRLAERLAGADALVHLAFVLMGGGLGRARHDREVVRASNVEGAQRVFEAARAAGVARAVFLSSVAVYGAWPGNPDPIPEHQPLRPNPGFAYAEDKAAVEAWLDRFEAEHEPPVVVRLRAHAILGPHAHPLLRGIARLPLCPRIEGRQPRTQCLWEEDAVTAVIAALRRGGPGAYNLAAGPAMSLCALHRANGRRPMPVSLRTLERLHALAWRITPLAGDPGWVQGLRHDLVVDCTRARRELGWVPGRTSVECFGAD
jgi:nucleoside-diphosphate-sugar epimerase